MKDVGESERFVVAWGRNKKGEVGVFFIHHKDIDKFKGYPTSPKDLAKRMIEFADRIDKAKGKI